MLNPIQTAWWSAVEFHEQPMDYIYVAKEFLASQGFLSMVAVVSVK